VDVATLEVHRGCSTFLGLSAAYGVCARYDGEIAVVEPEIVERVVRVVGRWVAGWGLVWCPRVVPDVVGVWLPVGCRAGP